MYILWKTADQPDNVSSDKQVDIVLLQPLWIVSLLNKSRSMFMWFNLTNNHFEAWLKVNHPEHFRAGNNDQC